MTAVKSECDTEIKSKYKAKMAQSRKHIHYRPTCNQNVQLCDCGKMRDVESVCTDDIRGS